MAQSEHKSHPGLSMTYHGRMNAPIGNSDTEVDDLPEFEPFEGAELHARSAPLDGLVLQHIDMHLHENKKAHRTTSFQYNGLIIRRGQEFRITITFNRVYNPSIDEIMLEFVIGNNSHTGKDTYICIVLGNSYGGKWVGRVIQQHGTAVTVGITPSADCIVGKFSTYVTVMSALGKKRTKSTDIYILFNAWCRNDEVFLDNESQRTEYILNNQGTIYNGETNNVSSRPWNFGQNKPGVLEACFYIMNVSGMPLDDRKSAIKVTRRASAMVNSLDDNGVLVGNWSGEYGMGTSPTSWTGSAEILLKYYSTGTPVCFAQCWVYAGVLNTFFRCLGMPARVITNFNSAHDNNGNLKTDIFVDKHGRMDRRRTRDSVWNYHCWNEVYMHRLDLPKGYDGWQVLDATPQETSDGLYRCGPTSVTAIKNGEVCYPYDGPFVFAEVNSNVVFHLINKYGQPEIANVNTTHIGTKIITKAVGSNMAEDITHTYKYPEGSASDRAAMDRATSFGCETYRSPFQQTDVTIELSAPSVQLGQRFHLNVGIKNTSMEQRTVHVTISGSVCYYTGVDHATFKEEKKIVSLEPLMTDNMTVEILGNEYMNFMVDQGYLSFTCVGRIQENSQVVIAKRVVRLEVPILTLKLDTPEVMVGHEMSITLVFTNIFDIILENVYLKMEGPGQMGFKFKYYNFIAPRASLTWTEIFVPEKAGEETVVASLDSPMLRQVFGELHLNIQP